MLLDLVQGRILRIRTWICIETDGKCRKQTKVPKHLLPAGWLRAGSHWLEETHGHL